MFSAKKILFFLILIVAITASSIRLVFILGSQTAEKDKAKAAETIYTIKDLNGKIAVYGVDPNKPIKVFETPLVNELPINDQKKLLTGIKAKSKKELTLKLQDYDN